MFFVRRSREYRRWKRNQPVERLVQKNVYEQGNPIYIIEPGPMPKATYVAEDTPPTEATFTRTEGRESWLIVLEVRQFWEQKNGRETGKLIREEPVRVVSRVRADRWRDMK